MKNLTIAIIQLDIIWEDIDQNLQKIKSLIKGYKNTDIVILPEFFNTGFSMNKKKISEKINGKTMQWMRKTALEYNIAIAGSILINENEKYYNSFIWINPDGEHFRYNKRHLFRYSNEHNHLINGEEQTIINYKGWKFCPQVCYDLRFPAWSRNTFENNELKYDCLIYVANWPMERSKIWTALLKARAIENHSYVVGVNRVGIDNNELEYNGKSAIINPLGNKILKTPKNIETITSIELSYQELLDYRNTYKFYLDGDNFTINM